MSEQLIWDLSIASMQTLGMTFIPCLLAVMLGLPLGVLLYLLGPKGEMQNLCSYKILDFLVNVLRSFPFIILLIALLPVTRFLVGSSIGTTAAMVPLTIAAIPYLGRLIENALLEVPAALVTTANAMGANLWQLVKVLLQEALAPIIRAVTMTLVALVGYSAMAGAVGAGGLGDVAIRYGYQRFNIDIMLITIVLLLIIVQLIQQLGDYLAYKVAH